VIGVCVLADTSIAIAVKPWVNVSDYVAACAEINLAIVDALRSGGVHYPMAINDTIVVNPGRSEDRSRKADAV
jgi:hypothetical protein